MHLQKKPDDPDTQQKSTASSRARRWIRAKGVALFPAASAWFSTRRKNRAKGRKRTHAAECEEAQDAESQGKFLPIPYGRRRTTSKSSARLSTILHLLSENPLSNNLHNLYFILLRSRNRKVFLRLRWRRGVGNHPWMPLRRSGAFSFACCSYGRSGTNVRRCRRVGSMVIWTV